MYRMIDFERFQEELSRQLRSDLKENQNNLTDHFLPLEKLGVKESVNIYSSLHKNSLLERVKSIFPSVGWLIGEEAFSDLGLMFISSLNHKRDSLDGLCETFISFLNTVDAPKDEKKLLSSMAKIDWFYYQCFQTPTVTAEKIAQNEDFEKGQYHLEFLPTVALVELDTLAFRVWQQQDRRKPEDFYFEQLTQWPQYLIFYKSKAHVHIKELDEIEYRFLKNLQSGDQVSQALRNLMYADLEWSPGQLNELFKFLFSNPIVKSLSSK